MNDAPQERQRVEQASVREAFATIVRCYREQRTRQQAPSLAGYLCEQCQDAPAVQWELAPEGGERAADPIVALGALFLGHAHHQGLQLWVNGGTPWSLAPLGAVKLLGHECTVPAKHRIGLDAGGDFRQRLLPERVANRRERLTVGIRQPHAARDLVAQLL